MSRPAARRFPRQPVALHLRVQRTLGNVQAARRQGQVASAGSDGVDDQRFLALRDAAHERVGWLRRRSSVFTRGR